MFLLMTSHTLLSWMWEGAGKKKTEWWIKGKHGSEEKLRRGEDSHVIYSGWCCPHPPAAIKPSILSLHKGHSSHWSPAITFKGSNNTEELRWPQSCSEQAQSTERTWRRPYHNTPVTPGDTTGEMGRANESFATVVVDTGHEPPNAKSLPSSVLETKEVFPHDNNRSSNDTAEKRDKYSVIHSVRLLPLFIGGDIFEMMRCFVTAYTVHHQCADGLIFHPLVRSRLSVRCRCVEECCFCIRAMKNRSCFVFFSVKIMCLRQIFCPQVVRRFLNWNRVLEHDTEPLMAPEAFSISVNMSSLKHRCNINDSEGTI